MKLFDIIKAVGGTALNVAFPGVGTAVTTMINAVLPSDAVPLPETATGDQIEATINTLPADKRADLLNREYDVKIEQIQQSNETLRTMLIADQKSTHTTRPRIALGAFRIVSFGSVLVLAIWAVAVIRNDTSMVKVVVEGWPFVLAVLSPFVVLLRSYFGVLKAEHKNRMESFSGKTAPGAIASLIAAFKK